MVLVRENWNVIEIETSKPVSLWFTEWHVQNCCLLFFRIQHGRAVKCWFAKQLLPPLFCATDSLNFEWHADMRAGSCRVKHRGGCFSGASRMTSPQKFEAVLRVHWVGHMRKHVARWRRTRPKKEDFAYKVTYKVAHKKQKKTPTKYLQRLVENVFGMRFGFSFFFARYQPCLDFFVISKIWFCMSLCMLLCMSLCMFFFIVSRTFRKWVCLWLCMPLCMPLCVPLCMSLCMSLCMPLCLSLCMSLCVPLCMPLCMSSSAAAVLSGAVPRGSDAGAGAG